MSCNYMRWVMLPTGEVTDDQWAFFAETSESARRSLTDPEMVLLKYRHDDAIWWLIKQRIGDATVYRHDEIKEILTGPDWTAP